MRPAKFPSDSALSPKNRIVFEIAQWNTQNDGRSDLRIATPKYPPPSLIRRINRANSECDGLSRSFSNYQLTALVGWVEPTAKPSLRIYSNH